MNRSPIEWTSFTSNPLQYRDADGNVVWGCVHASPGCQKCYSEALAKRYGRGGKFDTATMEGLTPFINEKEIHSILTYKTASGKMCFLGDMTDIFGEWVPRELIVKIFAAMALRDDVVFQVLTKRANRMQEIVSDPEFQSEVWIEMAEHGWTSREDAMTVACPEGTIYPIDPAWPLMNLWLGVSVENQEYANKRIPLLLQTPAAKRFVSYEPALGPVIFTDFQIMGHSLDALRGEWCSSHTSCLVSDKGDESLDWIIVGGESGPGARPMQPEWARSVRDQCVAAGVPFFFKQWGGVQKKKAGRELDGREWSEFPK